MANVCPRILQENDDLKHEVNILHNQIEELEQYGLGNKDVVLVVFEIFLLHKDRVFYLPITKTAYQLTFTVVYRPNNVGAINIVFG
jgi:hypothetical protein